MSTPDMSKDTPPVNPELTEDPSPSWMKNASLGMMIVGILGFLYLIAFHLGAAVLSFQTYGSFLWAILDFFFPYFYYPYYAFVLHQPAPAPAEPGMMGGVRRMVRKMVSRRRTMGHKPWKTL